MVKNYDNMLSHFHLILEHNGRMDRIAISISRVSVLTHDKTNLFMNWMDCVGRLFVGDANEMWVSDSDVV